MTYAERIKTIVPGFDPRHIEAFMRLERGTIGDLSPSYFAMEARAAAQCVREGGSEMAEKLARSYGL